jgi:hypothetical protein
LFRFYESEELQPIDLIAGSIFQKLEQGNDEYYDILCHNKSRLKIEGIELVKKVR